MVGGHVIAGLDMGNDITRVLVAEYGTNGILQIVGQGAHRSDGLRKGVVVNIEAARESVLAAVESAEQEAGRTVSELWVSLGGVAVDGMNSRGVVAVSGKNREIAQTDVNRVLEAARAVVIPMDKDILHLLPQEYIIDDQGGIRNPMDMIGVRLEAEVHIVTASVSAIQNMTKAVERADYRIRDITLGTLASARVVLNEHEKEMGVLLVDIGARTTDFICVQNGAPRLTGSLPIGGDQATSDLSIVLKTPMDAAEHIKCESGSCWPEEAHKDESVVVPGIGGRTPVLVPVTELTRILHPRMEELFRMIRGKLEKNPGAMALAGGVVLTGGGSLMCGVEELAGDVFNAPARVGYPKDAFNLSSQCHDPRWSTAAGLIHLGEAVLSVEIENNGSNGNGKSQNLLKGFVHWLGEFF